MVYRKAFNSWTCKPGVNKYLFVNSPLFTAIAILMVCCCQKAKPLPHDIHPYIMGYIVVLHLLYYDALLL